MRHNNFRDYPFPNTPNEFVEQLDQTNPDSIEDQYIVGHIGLHECPSIAEEAFFMGF